MHFGRLLAHDERRARELARLIDRRIRPAPPLQG
jgi:hypothetical protein